MSASATRFPLWWRAFGLCFFGYVAYYLGRSNMAAVQSLIRKDLSLSAEDIGTLFSVFTGTYAAGKLVNGILTDRLGGRLLFVVGLVGSAICNGWVGSAQGFVPMLAAWGLNAFFQTMGWPALIKIMSDWLTPQSLGSAMGIMSLNYLVGATCSTQLARFLTVDHAMPWPTAFITPAAIMLAFALLIGFKLPARPAAPPPRGTGSLAQTPLAATSESWARRLWAVVSSPRILCLLPMSFLITLIRKFFDDWGVDLVEGWGHGADAANLMSWYFTGGIVGTIVTGIVTDRVFNGRRGPYVLLSLLALMLLFGFMIHRVNSGALSAQALAWILAGIGFFMLGPYSLMGGVAAIQYGSPARAGTATAVIDFVGYCGAILSGYGAARFRSVFGLPPLLLLFLAMIGVTCLTIIVFTRWEARADR